MNRNFFLFCLFAGLVSMLVADEIKLKEPADCEVVSPLTMNQRMVAKMPIAQLEELFTDPIFVKQLDSTPAHSIPPGITMRWSFAGDRSKIHYELLLSENKNFADARKILPAHSTYALNNLIPGKTYFWKVQSVTENGTVTAESDVRSFTVEDLYPRVLALPDAWNVRDLGGKPAMAGRKIPYGKIYRSGGLNNNSADGGKTPGKNLVTEASIREALEVLKIRTELDLRWDGEVAGMTQSPLGPSVQYIHISTVMYGSLFTKAGMDNYAELFRLFTHPENYPIDFHCIAGADRTGTLSFLLHAVLGCSEDDIRRDYVYTSIYSMRYFANADALIRGMDVFGAVDEPLQYKAERFLLQAGITPEEIHAFQTIVLGDELPLSPVLTASIRVREMKSQFQPTDLLSVVDGSAVKTIVKQCGKEYEFRPMGWTASPVKFVGSDGNGRFMVVLQNSSQIPRQVKLVCPGLENEKYNLTDIQGGVRYMQPAPSGLSGLAFWKNRGVCAWFKETILLQPKKEYCFLLTPAGQEAPECAEIKTMLPIAEDYLTAVAIEEPVIDGKEDTEFWAAVQPVELRDIEGRPVLDHRVTARLATNASHDTLYALVHVEDDTFNGNPGKRDSDASWSGDDVEFFISSIGSEEYYQLVFGRGGCYLDGKGQDVSWNTDAVQYAITSDDEGWTVEVALPLEEFNLTGPLALNICSCNQPAGLLRNLGVTGGAFHNREAMRPVLLK